jgi:hypothetical protein
LHAGSQWAFLALKSKSGSFNLTIFSHEISLVFQVVKDFFSEIFGMEMGWMRIGKVCDGWRACLELG